MGIVSYAWATSKFQWRKQLQKSSALYFLVTAIVSVILLDWTGVDLIPKSTPYAEEAVELQDSNMTPDQIYYK
jgi:hypothetical protein